MVTLQEAVRLVGSEKATERQEGLQTYRRIFGDDRTCEAFARGIRADDGVASIPATGSGGYDVEGNEARWLRILQPLFGCVVRNRQQCLKQGHWREARKPTIDRLKESASVVLLVVERGHSFLSQNVVASVFNHLTQTIVVQYELLEPIALTYLNAINVLLSFPPHLEHLDGASWKRAVSLAFAVALREPITDKMWQEGEDAESNNELDAATSGRASMLKMEQVEAINILRVVMSNPYAPFLDERQGGTSILTQYTQLFALYPIEKSIHLPTLVAVNYVIAALDVSQVEALTAFACRNWKIFLGLWSTKSRALKEQLTITLGSLVAYVRYGGKVDLIQHLAERIVREVEDRHSPQPLRLAALSLCQIEQPDIFQHKGFQLNDRNAESILTWCILELGSDCLAASCTERASDTSGDSLHATPLKRRRLDDGSSSARRRLTLQELILNSPSESSLAIQIWNRQLLCFFLAKHHDSTPENVLDAILKDLVDTVSLYEGENQAWTLLCLSEAVNTASFRERAASIWQSVRRLISRASTIRLPANLARTMLINNAAPRCDLPQDIKGIILDTCDHGAAWPSDAFCGLLCEILHKAKSDVGLSSMHFEEQIFRWLQRSVVGLGADPPSAKLTSRIDPADLASLLLAMTSEERGKDLGRPTPWLRQNVLYDWCSTHEEKGMARRFILQGELDESLQAVGEDEVDTKQQNDLRTTIRPEEEKTLSFLNSLIASIDDGGFRDEKIKRQALVEVCVTTIIVHSAMLAHGVELRMQDTSGPFIVLSDVLESFCRERNQLEDVNTIIAIVAQLLPRRKRKESPARSAFQPDAVTRLESMEARSQARHSSARMQRLADIIWNSPLARKLLTAFERLLQFHFKSADAFGNYRDLNGIMSHEWNGPQDSIPHDEMTSEYCLSDTSQFFCLAALAQSARNSANSDVLLRVWAAALPRTTQRRSSEVKILLDWTPLQNKEVAEEVIDMIYESLGSDLAQYQAERDTGTHEFAVDIITRSMPLWFGFSEGDQSRTTAADVRERGQTLCQFFLRLFKKGHLHCSVVKKILSFLPTMSKLSAKQHNAEHALPKMLRVAALEGLLLEALSAPWGDVRLEAARLAAMIPKMISPVEGSSGISPEEAQRSYDAVIEALPANLDNISEMSTRVFAIGTLLMTSCLQRHKALFHLVESACESQSIHNQARSILRISARDLGFESPAKLWDAFASQLTWAFISTGYDILDMPFEVIGFSGKEDFVKQLFLPTGSVLLAMDTQDSLAIFKSICKLAHQDEKEGLARCIPFLYISHLTSLSAERKSDRAIRADAEKMLARRLKAFKVTRNASECVAAEFPRIVVELLARFYQNSPGTLTEVLVAHDKELAQRYRHFQGSTSSKSEEPCKPSAEGSLVFRCLIALSDSDSGVPSIGRPDIIIEVIITLSSRLLRQRFANDLKRQVQACHLFLATIWDSICNHEIVLAQILRSCVELMTHAHLFEPFQRVFLACLEDVQTPHATLDSTLLHACEAAGSLMAHEESRIRRIAHETVTRIESFVSTRLGDVDFEDVILKVLHGWPFPIPEAWIDTIPICSPQELIEGIRMCRNYHASSLKRLLKALQNCGPLEKQAFFSSRVWNLTAKMDHGCSLLGSEEECYLVFGDILQESGGKLGRPEAHMILPPLGEDGLVRCFKDIANCLQSPLQPLRSWITEHLIKRLWYGNPMETERAYECLAGIVGASKDFIEGAGSYARVNGMAKQLDLIVPRQEIKRNDRMRHSSELGEIFIATRNSSLDGWASWLAILLLNLMAHSHRGSGYFHLARYIEHAPKEAKELLPAVLYLFLKSGVAREHGASVQALSHHVDCLTQHQGTNPEIWSALIDAVLIMRNDHPQSEIESAVTHLKGVDHICLAKRAVQCGRFASSLLLLEIAREEYKGSTTHLLASPSAQSVQNDIYSNIEDPDMFYGAVDGNVQESLLRRLKHEGHWDKVMGLQAAEYEVSGGDLRTILQTIRKQGFERLALDVQSARTSDYDAAWRTQDWTLPMVDRSTGTSSHNLYSALRVVHTSSDPEDNNDTLKAILALEVRNFFDVGCERRKVANDTVKHLLGIREVLHYNDKGTVIPQSKAFGPLSRFDDVELVYAVKQSLLQLSLCAKQTDLKACNYLEEIEASKKLSTQLHVYLSERAREEGRLEVAVKAIAKARLISTETDAELDREFANILWFQGEHSIAIKALSQMIARSSERASSEPRDSLSRGLALAQLGHWQATAYALKATSIDAECFKPALELLRQSKDAIAYADHAYTYAKFAEEQFRSLAASDELSTLEAFIKLRDEEIKQLEELSKSTGRAQGRAKVFRSIESARKMVDIDRKRLQSLEHSKSVFRIQAGKLYATKMSVADGESDVDASVRLTSLLFEHSHDDIFVSALSSLVKRIPSRKFVSLTPQICSRLSSSSLKGKAQTACGKIPCSTFQSLVVELCYAMGREHPFHALYPIYALARGQSESDVQIRRKSSGGTSASQADRKESQDQRRDLAVALIERIKNAAARSNRIVQWQLLCDACVEWAQVSLPIAMPQIFGKKATGSRKKTEKLRIPLHQKIVGLRDLDVPIMTRSLDIDPTCNYAEIVGIARFIDRFTTAGGIHLPKIVACLGTDGRVYRQLFKDQDDLRQDAVMQQVFRLVNGLLIRDRRATERSLHVRTYNVVPLGPQYGLLEFVESTTPLLAPILDLYTRHSHMIRMAPSNARQELANAQQKPAKERALAYKSVCERMPPVFRLYFLERCTDPFTFLGCRLNYSRSVATSSIVGHILGLGDRHSSNILLDEDTGEVVHIDFGVAFDQGRLLPIPELVPFRLTQNVIDGMGMDGVEGVFRRGSEETLRVLRQGASVIKTILEVFRYDPLYDWTQNPIKVIQGQAHDEASSTDVDTVGGSSSTARMQLPAARLLQARTHQLTTGEGKEVAELLAERAINSVMSKLSTQLSVEYTVNDLIERACDPTYLGSIFHGWQAAL